MTRKIVTAAAAAALLLAAGTASAAPEECNGLDDDDDGLTDEDVIDCADGEVCTFAQCLADCSGDAGVCDQEHACFEGTCHLLCNGDDLICPLGWVCDLVEDAWCCIPDVCDPSQGFGLPCAGNPYCCDEGATPPCHCEGVPRLCVDDCWGKECPEGWICVPEAGGQCLSPELGCYATGCDEGQVCAGGECTEDPCSGVECDAEEYCNADGACAMPCLLDQCPGQGCFEGQCVDDPCAGVDCNAGMSCEEGDCVVGGCWGVACEYWEICEDGDCVDDPCWNVDCPDCMLCIGGGCYEYSAGSDADGDADADADTDADAGGGPLNPAAEPPESLMGATELRCGCHLAGRPGAGLAKSIIGPLLRP